MNRLRSAVCHGRRFWTSASSIAQPGQFGLPGLHSARDWERIALQCVKCCENAAEKIRATSNDPTIEVLQLFDDLSNDICTVLDTAELCRNVHPNPEFVDAANNAYTLVSTMTVGFNADRSLYEPLARLHASDVVLSDEQKAMLTSLKLDFERGGINLSSDERSRVASLQNHANALGAQFSSNVASADAFVEVEEAKLQEFPPALLAKLRRQSNRPGSVSVPIADPVVIPVAMKYIEDSETRKLFYKAENSRCAKSNLPILDSLLEARHEFANLLGSKSYAELSFPGRLASSPGRVLSFLDKLSSDVNSAALLEDKLLVDAKVRAEFRPANPSPKSHVEPWDRSHYMGKAKARAFEFDSRTISEYLPLDACLSGMAAVMEKVFGVTLVHVPRSQCKSELWHKDVVKMELRHETEGVQGHVYLDLYPRAGKYGHAAHFCLRGGRDPGSESEYQSPVVALVCNFAPSGEVGVPALLSFSEYETLWHEWGHAMHSLVSRTRYQHLSGTRVATDLVEVPSHVFEHFAWDPRVLSEISTHYRVGDSMPTRLIHAICASRHQFVASDLQFQTLYASLDLIFHGATPPVRCTGKVAAELQNRLTNVGHVDGTSSQAAFQHFVGYGAGYYSYIFARILSSQIWESLFLEDPFCRAAGERLREQMLCRGAAVEPADILLALLRENPSCDSYFKAIGLSATSPSLELPLINEQD